ncbi:hypothetical protein A8144_07565 [Mycobacterium leprae 3125609]|nr:hypothetical protein A8144_07565 [Mycobacterium leprae 3125609]OAX70207.1 hypothetical protein A3216_13270 [Mycobacterium leprae 7935681]
MDDTVAQNIEDLLVGLASAGPSQPSVYYCQRDQADKPAATNSYPATLLGMTAPTFRRARSASGTIVDLVLL